MLPDKSSCKVAWMYVFPCELSTTTFIALAFLSFLKTLSTDLENTLKSVCKSLNTLERIYGVRFYELFKSITCDNGAEFLNANGIIKSCRRKDFARTQLFYAHPYCASERGSNENANRLIRRFLPKGTDFTSLSQKDSVHLAMWMNKYPRKLHDGSSAWQLSKVYSYHFNRISV